MWAAVVARRYRRAMRARWWLLAVASVWMAACPPSLPPASVGTAPIASTAPEVPPETEEADAASCGTERWSVKVGSDPGARQPMPVMRTTIAELRAIPRPAHLPEAQRVAGAETTLYELHDVLLTKVKKEA